MARKKRVYEVVNNNPYQSGLKVGKETLKFNRDNFMYVDDEAKGQEIKKLYDGTDAIVNETEVYSEVEPGHNYFFGAKKSKGWNDFWERYEKKKRKEARRMRRREVNNDI